MPSIHKLYRADRPNKPFGARWASGKKRNFKFFSTSKERDDFMAKFEAAQKKVGNAILAVSASEAEVMADCVKRLGSISEVLRAVG